MSTKYDKISWISHRKLQAPELNEFQSIQNNKIDNAFIAALGKSKGVRHLTVNPTLNGLEFDATIFAYSTFFSLKVFKLNDIFTSDTNVTYEIYAKIEEIIVTSLEDPVIAIPITKEETSVRVKYNCTIEYGDIVPIDIENQPDGFNIKYVPITKITGNKNITPTVDLETYPTYPKLDPINDFSYTPVNKAGDDMSGFLTLSNDPELPMHAATKQYVDSFVQGLDAKASVRLATTENITLSGLFVLDNVQLVEGDRVLVKDQDNKLTNGIYEASNGNWNRSKDASESNQVTAGMFTFVEEGTENENNGFVLITNDPIELNVTELEFVQFSGAGQIIPGVGIGKEGNSIFLLDTPITPGTYRSVTVDKQGRVTAATNPTTAAGYGLTDVITIYGGQTINGSLATRGTMNVGGQDLRLGTFDQVTRGDSGISRALVKDTNTVLAINYNGDFTGGVRIDGPKLNVVGEISVGKTLAALGSSNKIGVGTATIPSKTEGIIDFTSNGPNGSGGAIIKYNPPAIGNGQVTNEMIITSSGVYGLEKLSMIAKESNFSGNVTTEGNITTKGNITTNGDINVSGKMYMNGFEVLTANSPANRFSWDGSRISVDGGTNNAAVNLSDNANYATNADKVDNLHASSFMRTDINTTTVGSVTANSFYTGNWFRSTGATGWYSQDFGGGIHMEDTTWVKVYNNKNFLVNGVIKAMNGLVVPVGTNKYSTI